MLAFFYKHQKKFIGFVIVAVCVSGIGIGWGRHPGESIDKKQRKKIVFTIEGKKYSEREFHAFKKFFMHEAYPFTGNPQEWNFLNEGLLTERFLTNKLGEKLFLKVYSQFPAFSKEKNYQAYRRFDTPFISAEEVWKSSAPHLYEALTQFQQIDDPVSPSGFAARVRLFLEEKKFPHYILKQMLEYRRKMFHLPHDAALLKGKDLRLFGYGNLSDWFGDAYVSTAVETLLRFVNEQKKHISMPSIKEAQQDFYDKAKQAFTKLSKHTDVHLTFDQFVASYFDFIGVSSSEFFKIYREILLCKRAFLQLEGGVTFDYRPLQEFFSMGKDSTSVEIVKLPREYHFKTLTDLEAFEVYLRLVGESPQDCLDVPRFVLPIKKIKAKEPKLVGRRFLLTYQTIRLQDLETKVPMIEVHQWQQNPDNFHILLQEFPKIETCTSSKDFQNLPPSLVEKIHSFTRKEILRACPEKIQACLSQSVSKNNEVFLSSGKDSVLEGILDGRELAALLIENEALEFYTQDKEHYYTFIVDTCFGDEEIIPYREVLRKGLGKILVDAHKDSAHMDRVVTALKSRYPGVDGKDLWQRRLWHLVEEQRSGAYQAGTLPWNLDKSIKIFTRGDQELPQPYEVLASMEEGALSQVEFHVEEGPFFYKCLSHEIFGNPACIEKLFLAKEHLNEEILVGCMERFIDQARGVR
ncbi:hypothetical protein [Chlamydia gallinacea]|uniref:Uncharacterized protein n=2 Tax=Chlamydia gallinacea TaxID=1457153 RepID=A0A173DZN5_9CHLA|nr:hypothetical protein [Chlamydia gallinacea]ANG66390.1 hypothetical protein M787_003580 [Chlamydia gallinacea 08-1274/3]AQT77414.1 hypothetical protein B1F83_02015 [Chlamydia gallinacea]MBX6680168.1 hypothetical protein [Chlamydia gallinacea]MBX6687682.1 hypothetical protein [Chlamydia gallinacea]